MASLEEIYKSYTRCINEERWQDLPTFVSFPLDLNGERIETPEAMADKIKAPGGRLRLETDAITVDETAQRLAASELVKLQDVGDGGDKTAEFTQQSIFWAADGKISRIATVSDDEALQRQLSDPSYVAAPHDLIRNDDNATTVTETGMKLSAPELNDAYRAYNRCFNERTTERDFPTFCHEHVVHNAKRLSLDEYRRPAEAAFAVVPDLVLGIDALVADAAAQRVVVRIELAGTPVAELAGAKPTGRSVRFFEHATYDYRDGKIERVRSIIDWKSYRRELSQE
ncbi:SnoaL-domain-containing protein [Nemania sp. NC0429]|nr:SnoaL-domain-containing protein [Nemania sp. NC0429]